MRMAVEGDESGVIREQVARAIWDANTVSASLTEDKFGDLISRAGDLRYNEKGAVVGPGSFVHYAEQGGWQRQQNGELGSVVFSVPGELINTVPGSEDALALEFADGRRLELRYVDKWGKWMAFDGRRWGEAATPGVWNLIRKVARNAAVRLPSTQGRNLLSRTKIAGVEALARGQLLAAADQWDTNAWALNTPAGIVDLRSGELHPAMPEAYCTKMTAVAPGEQCPRWRQFLDEITGGDVELQNYLKRLAGYAVVGQVSEHVLIFLYGTGGNGKGVFLNTITGLLGDYAKVAPIDTFTESKSDRHPTDMAMLQGARFVTAQETDEGRAWAEARIKALTGGDPVTARFMHQDFFTYTPQFTLVIAGNHKPRLRNVDEAIKRRLHMVPFTQNILAEKRDPELAVKLREEWPGILRWAIEGCLEWQQIGLAPPGAVLGMTEQYFAEQDRLSAWIEDCCIADKAAWTATGDLYNSYVSHANAAKEYVETRDRFCALLESHGFQRGQHGKQRTRGFRGIALRPPEEEVRL
jgi:putative DNA primase/helicase